MATASNKAGPRRSVAAALYLLGARHLPWSPRPGGQASLKLRYHLVRLMLDRCGTGVNVEHGAWFGSGKGIEVGDNSAIGMDALVIGELTIGSNVMMGPRCMLMGVNHRFDDLETPMNTQGFMVGRRIVIEDDVWIGAGVIILPGRRIGRGSIVGAGSVVTSDIPSMSIASGNPATVRRTRDWRQPDAGADPAITKEGLA